MTDFETWLLDDGYERIFRYLKYRLPGQFTPEEMEKKYSDQQLEYIDTHYEYMKIETAIELPDSDVLLEFHPCFKYEDGEFEILDHLRYLKLSQIELLYVPEDQALDD